MLKVPKHTGFTLIEMVVVIVIIALIAAIAIPNLLRARASANEASAISSLRTLVSSQAMFHQSDIEEDGEYDYATTLEELREAGLIDSVLAGGVKSGYLFIMTTHDERQLWTATGVPGRSAKGEHTFFVDQDGGIVTGHCGNGIVEASEQCEPGMEVSCSVGKACVTWSCQCED